MPVWVHIQNQEVTGGLRIGIFMLKIGLGYDFFESEKVRLLMHNML